MNSKGKIVKNETDLQTIIGICFMISIPIITLFWSNRDFFRYYYKFDSGDVIEAVVPQSEKYGRTPLWTIKLEFQYEDKRYAQSFPKKIFEDAGDTTELHAITNPLHPEKPIFVRNFIIPHIFSYVLLYIIFFPLLYYGLPALQRYRDKS